MQGLPPVIDHVQGVSRILVVLAHVVPHHGELEGIRGGVGLVLRRHDLPAGGAGQEDSFLRRREAVGLGDLHTDDGADIKVAAHIDAAHTIDQ